MKSYTLSKLRTWVRREDGGGRDKNVVDMTAELTENLWCFSLLCNLSDCTLASQLVHPLSQTILCVQCLLWNLYFRDIGED